MNIDKIAKLIRSTNREDNILGVELLKQLKEDQLLEFFTRYGSDNPDNLTVFKQLSFGRGVSIAELFKIGRFYLYVSRDNVYLDTQHTYEMTDYRELKLEVLK